MKRKGFTLIEAIIGIFLIGLISIVGLPMIQNTVSNYSRVKEKQEMLYLCEMVVERLRAKDNNLQYIFTELESNDEIILSEIGGLELEKFKCRILKSKETNAFINLDVKIYIDNEMGSSQYVEYKTVVKK